MHARLIIVCIFFELAVTPSVFAQVQTVLLNDARREYELGARVEYLIDADRRLTIDDVRSPDVSLRFQRSLVDAPNFGLTNDVIWFRFAVQNETHADEWLLHLKWALLDWVNCYIIDSTHVLRQFGAGTDVPFSERLVLHRQLVFPIDVPTGETRTVYLQVRTRNAFEVPLSISPQAVFRDNAYWEQFFFAFYYGIMAAMILYNLFLFISVRDVGYLYYVSYATGFVCVQMFIDGYLFQFFSPNLPTLHQIWGRFAIGFAGVMWSRFAQVFLLTQPNLPTMHRVLDGFIACFIGSMAFSILYPSIYSLTVAATLVMLLMPILFWAGVLRWRQGYASAAFYTLAFVTFFVGAVVYGLKTFNLVPITPLTNYMMQVGSAMEVILLSLALADRLNQLKKEKDLALRRQLEAKFESDRAKDEAEIERLKNVELARALSELKAAQDQLIQQEKLAALGQLTAGIAHEIQNPLNFVNNFSEVSKKLVSELKAELERPDNIDKTYVDEILHDIGDNASIIAHHGKRASSIVTSMLRHARVENNERSETDLNALLKEYLAISYHSYRAQDRNFNVRMTTTFDETLQPLKISSQDIGRVFLNIIQNGFYAANQKAAELKSSGKLNGYAPELSITTAQQNGKVVIRIRDNGIGIDEHVKKKLFEPFFTTKKGNEGTGLGLSISNDIIKAYGGSISVESVAGEYAEFIITLPKT